MKDWRGTLTKILRSAGGEAHLSEIYSEVESLGTDLGQKWKASTGGALEKDSSDSKLWTGNYDIFSLKEKGSGIWSLRTNAFRQEILNPDTKFFIFTTGKDTDKDKDFETYTWNTKSFNKVREGDLFIYKISQTVSPNRQFYFFGAGKIDSLFEPEKGSQQFQSEGDRCARISQPIHFKPRIYQKNLKPKDLGGKRKDWKDVFSQHGMDEIPLERFLYLLNKGTGDILEFDEEKKEENDIYIKAHNKISDHDFSVPDFETTTSSRGKYQAYFRNILVLPNYEYKCAITGIETTSLLTAAHILKWSEHEDKRLDPQNGICLSPLVDKCFENNLICIDDDFKVVIHKDVKQDKALYAQLKTYEGKKISMPKNKDAQPKREYLKMHRERS